MYIHRILDIPQEQLALHGKSKKDVYSFHLVRTNGGDVTIEPLPIDTEKCNTCIKSFVGDKKYGLLVPGSMKLLQ